MINSLMKVGPLDPGCDYLQWWRYSLGYLHSQVNLTKESKSIFELGLRWLRLKTYHWRGLYEIPTYRSCAKINCTLTIFFIRIYAGARSSVSLGSFLPMVGSSSSGIPSPASKGILQFVFPILIDFRWFAIICLVTGFLITELNTFYLKWGLCWAIFWSF